MTFIACRLLRFRPAKKVEKFNIEDVVVTCECPPLSDAVNKPLLQTVPSLRVFVIIIAIRADRVIARVASRV